MIDLSYLKSFMNHIQEIHVLILLQLFLDVERNLTIFQSINCLIWLPELCMLMRDFALKYIIKKVTLDSY